MFLEVISKNEIIKATFKDSSLYDFRHLTFDLLH